MPLGLDYPYRATVQPDLAHHVREVALPVPGSDTQLVAQVARLHSRVLDRHHPLWEFYVISGAAHGYVAIYQKIHHVVIDGVPGAEVRRTLLDLTAEVRAAEPPPPPATT